MDMHSSAVKSGMDFDLILRDMADGVMVIAKNGTINYLNSRGEEILGVDSSAVGQTLAALFIEEAENDSFTQNILDAVYNKGLRQKQILPFFRDGKKRILELSTTFSPAQNSLILVFTDVTEREQERKKRRDSTVFISLLFTLVSLSVLIYELLEMVIPGVIPANIYTVVVEIIAAVFAVISFKLNGYKLSELISRGRNFMKYLPYVLGAIAVCMAAMCSVKAGMLYFGIEFFEEGKAFINLSHWTLSSTLYPITVLYQEIMTRCFVHEKLKDVFTGKYRVLLAVIISSLIFAVMHISYGFPMMFFSFLLLSLFGFLYEKIGNIWLLCIIHYSLGTFANLLNFL